MTKSILEMKWEYEKGDEKGRLEHGLAKAKERIRVSAAKYKDLMDENKALEDLVWRLKQLREDSSRLERDGIKDANIIKNLRCECDELKAVINKQGCECDELKAVINKQGEAVNDKELDPTIEDRMDWAERNIEKLAECIRSLRVTVD